MTYCSELDVFASIVVKYVVFYLVCFYCQCFDNEA